MLYRRFLLPLPPPPHPSLASTMKTVVSRIESTPPFDWVIIVGLLLVMFALVTLLCTDKRNGIVQEKGSVEESFADANSCYAHYHYERFANPVDAVTASSIDLRSMQPITKPNAHEVVLVFIYHNKCGHCHRFRPMWDRLCTKYQGQRRNGKTVRLYSSGNDVDESLWTNVSKHFNVQGYPTVMVIRGDGASEYTGPRNEFDMWCAHIEQQTSA